MNKMYIPNFHSNIQFFWSSGKADPKSNTTLTASAKCILFEIRSCKTLIIDNISIIFHYKHKHVYSRPLNTRSILGLYSTSTWPILGQYLFEYSNAWTFSMSHSFHVALFSFCNLFMLEFFHIALFPCCTFSISNSFHVALFPCCTLFMSHSFHVALFPCWDFSILYFFHIALFSCCTFFMLHSFHASLF